MLPLQQKWLFFGHFWLLKFQFDLRFVWPIYVTENNNFAPILPGNVLPCCMWAEQRVNIRISNSVSGGGTFDRLSIKLIIKKCVISFPANKNATLSKFALSFFGTQSDTVKQWCNLAFHPESEKAFQTCTNVTMNLLLPYINVQNLSDQNPESENINVHSLDILIEIFEIWSWVTNLT